MILPGGRWDGHRRTAVCSGSCWKTQKVCATIEGACLLSACNQFSKIPSGAEVLLFDLGQLEVMLGWRKLKKKRVSEYQVPDHQVTVLEYCLKIWKKPSYRNTIFRMDFRGRRNVPEIPWHLLKSREANPMRWEWLITWGCLEFDGDPRLPFGGCAKLLRRGRW